MQEQRLEKVCIENKYDFEVIYDLGSGINYNKKGLNKSAFIAKRFCCLEKQTQSFRESCRSNLTSNAVIASLRRSKPG